MLEHGFRKYEIIKLLNDIKKRIKRVEENVPIQIDTAVNQLLDGAPEALDTLKELADALGNDSNFAVSINSQITELNNRINIKKDWNQNDENADDYIKNRTHYFEKGECIFYTQYYNGPSTPRDSIDDIINRLFTSIENQPNDDTIMTTSYFSIESSSISPLTDFGKVIMYVVYKRSTGIVSILGSFKTGDATTAIDKFTDVQERIKVTTNELTENAIYEAINEFIEEIEQGNIYNNNIPYHCIKGEDVYHKLDKEYLYTPDWNENNEEDGSFIKNRTHYAEKILVCKHEGLDTYDNFKNLFEEQFPGGLWGVVRRKNDLEEVFRIINTTNGYQLVGPGNSYAYDVYFNKNYNNYLEFQNDIIKYIEDNVDPLRVGTQNEGYEFQYTNEYHKLDKNYLPDEIVNNVIEVTYSEIKSLRDNSELIPGKYYRITDYVTTTTQTETRSANHPFDIIVLALSENKLSEEAKAIQHEGDTYFNNSNLSAWRLKYCLDNDDERFIWAQTAGTKIYTDDELLFKAAGEIEIDGTIWYLWYNSEFSYGDGGEYLATTGALPEEESMASVISSDKTEVLENDYSTIQNVRIIDENGKGVIYQMIDEFENDCPYDFKNIQFARYLITNCDKSPSLVGNYGISTVNNNYIVDINSIIYAYTFSSEVSNGSVTDNSLTGDASKNKLKKYEGSLNNNVFFGISCYNTFGYNCHSNTFGHSCNANTFGNNSHSNTFGDSCDSNIFGHNCYYIIFGDGCQHNTFGNACASNIFGDNCSSNTFIHNCYFNTFGSYCSSNTFKNYCQSNIFGSYCSSNTFKNYCQSNTFGNSCYSNTFKNYCQSNTFGNSYESNTFENYCSFNTFGNNSPINYVKNIRLGNNCKYLYILSNDTLAKWDNCLQNVFITQEVQGTDNNNRLTITIPDRNLNYETKVGYNSRGELKIYCEAGNSDGTSRNELKIIQAVNMLSLNDALEVLYLNNQSVQSLNELISAIKVGDIVFWDEREYRLLITYVDNVNGYLKIQAGSSNINGGAQVFILLSEDQDCQIVLEEI